MQTERKNYSTEIQTDVVVVLVAVVIRTGGAVQIRKTLCVILIPGFHFHLRSVGGKNADLILS